MRRSYILFAILILPGCYSYARVPGPTQVGAEVEVELSDAGSASLAPLIGPHVVSIRGRTTDVAGDTVRLSVSSILKRRGVDERWSREPLALDRAYISSTRTRKFSWARSSLLALTVVGGAVLVGTAADIGVGGEPGPGKLPGQ